MILKQQHTSPRLKASRRKACLLNQSSAGLVLCMLGLSQLVGACTESNQPLPAKGRTQVENGTTDTPAAGSGAPTAPLLLVNPLLAEASIAKEVQIGRDPTIDGADAPIVTITKKNSDYVQLLRCAASYQLKNVTGSPLAAEDIEGMSETLARGIWLEAMNTDRSCKVVGTEITASQFMDLPAPSGEYYYIVNPCVSRERSTTREWGCSYRLSVSKPFTHENSLKVDLREKAIDLVAAESALNASVATVRLLAEKIELHLRACEDMVAHDKQLADFKMGMLQLAGMAVGATIGGLLGGPNSAVMLASLTGNIGVGLLNEHVLHQLTGAQIANECINPQVVATTASERGDAAWVNQNAGKYEEEFQVQGLTKKLQNYLYEVIPREQARVQAALLAMQALDEKVVTWDEAIAKATSQGLDVADPQQMLGN